MENAANRIALTGALDTLPEYSHTNHDRNFYRLTLCVERLSIFCPCSRRRTF